MMHCCAQTKDKGFTLVEAILLVSIVGIMMTLAFPNIISTFQYQRTFSEGQKMDMIRKGLESYSKMMLRLPAENTWWQDISPFVSLSENEILCDTWGRRRTYRHFTENNQEIGSSKYTVHYAVVLSYGENGCLGGGGSCTPVNNCNLGTLPSPGLTSSAMNSVDEYADFEAIGGDIVTKYTTYIDQVDAHNESRMRISRLSKALSDFATETYGKASDEVISTGGDLSTLRNFRFYPPSGAVGDNVNAFYHSFVRSSDGIPLTNLQGGNTDDTLRLNYMRRLVRFLGLPEVYCCNAALRNASGGESPFYYYSNPRELEPGNMCGARSGDSSLPAKVTDKQYVCG